MSIASPSSLPWLSWSMTVEGRVKEALLLLVTPLLDLMVIQAKD